MTGAELSGLSAFSVAAAGGGPARLLWWAAAAAAIAAVGVLLFGRQRPAQAAELAALGWRRRQVAAVTAAVAVVTAAGAGMVALRIGGGTLSQAVPAALSTGLAVSLGFPPILCSAVLTGHRAKRDLAVLAWLRRIRLYVAAGRPIGVAVLDAAERVPDQAFRPTAGAVNAAVAAGRDPLAAAARTLAGSESAVLLGTVDAAERSGAGASDLLDRVLDRVVRTMEDRRRESIDRLARSVAATASGISVIAGGLVMAAIVLTLPTV